MNKPLKALKLGQAVDLAFCAAKTKDDDLCNEVINGKLQKYCNEHLIAQYKKARKLRSEFTSGNSMFELSDPTLQKPIGKKRGWGTYFVKDKETVISTTATNVISRETIVQGKKTTREMHDEQLL